MPCQPRGFCCASPRGDMTVPRPADQRVEPSAGDRLMRASTAAVAAARDHAAQRPRPRYRLLQFGLGLSLFAFAMFLVAVWTAQRNARLAQDPIVSAVITKSWNESGKGGGHFASISYLRLQNGATVSCHVARFLIGPVSDHRGAGDRLDIAPRQNSCYEPDLPGRSSPEAPAALVFAGCLALGLGISLMVLGIRRARAQQADAPATNAS
jgi:hypothetical protein